MAEIYDGVSESELDEALAGKADTDHSHVHASLTGLANDDHPHYLNVARGDARYYTQSQLDATIAALTFSGLSDVETGSPEDGESIVYQSSTGKWVFAALAEGGVVDHGALIGLADDDHPQYLNVARGDARYYTQGQIDAGFMTSAAITAALDGKADTNHAHALGDLSNVDTTGAADGEALIFDQGSGNFITAEISTGGGGVTDHGALTGTGDDDHPQYLNVARGDDRYYTQGEVDALVAAVSPSRLYIATNHTAAPEDVIAVDTDTAAVTITAPETPAEGAYFFVGDAGGNAANNNITIDFNGENFDGAADNFVIDLNGFSSGFLYRGGEWELFG